MVVQGNASLQLFELWAELASYSKKHAFYLKEQWERSYGYLDFRHLANISPKMNNVTLSLRESIPRQVDKKSGGPQGEGRLGFSRRRKGQTLFFSFFFKSETDDYTLSLNSVLGII